MSDVSSCVIGSAITPSYHVAKGEELGYFQFGGSTYCLVFRPAITPSYHVAKGEELGYFQFGGSTYCLVFRPGVIAGFALAALPQPHDPNAPLVRVNLQVAMVRPARSG